MDTSHPYRSSAPLVITRGARRWSELDAELVTAALSATLVIAGAFEQCGQTGMTFGLLGLLASLCSIGGWLRRR
ncbi:MAG: hypothetical protein ABI175_18215 [Polyangiales bacterium]